jgi:hypothetical protein
MQKIKRKTPGHEIAQDLIAWLNATKDTHAGKRRVVALLIAMQEHRVQRKPKRRHQRLLEVFDRLAWYRRRVRLVMTIGPKNENWNTYWGLQGGQPEGDALSRLLNLHDRQLDHAIRQCRCGRWFFAKKTFCSRECQQTAYRSTASWRKTNREHQRAYRKRNFK